MLNSVARVSPGTGRGLDFEFSERKSNVKIRLSCLENFMVDNRLTLRVSTGQLLGTRTHILVGVSC